QRQHPWIQRTAEVAGDLGRRQVDAVLRPAGLPRQGIATHLEAGRRRRHVQAAQVDLLLRQGRQLRRLSVAIARQEAQVDQQQALLLADLQRREHLDATALVMPGVVQQIQPIGQIAAAHLHSREAVRRRTGRDCGKVLQRRRRCRGIAPQQRFLEVGAMQLPDAQAYEKQGPGDGQQQRPPRRTAKSVHADRLPLVAILPLSKYIRSVTWKPSTKLRWWWSCWW